MKKVTLFILSLIVGYYIFDSFIQKPAGIFGEYIVIHIIKIEIVREFFAWFFIGNRHIFLPAFLFSIDSLLFYWMIAIPLGFYTPKVIIRGLIWGAAAAPIHFYAITTIWLHKAATAALIHNDIHTQEAARRMVSLHQSVAHIEDSRLKIVLLMASILIPFSIYCIIGIKLREITNKSTLLRASGPTPDPLRGLVI